MPADREHCFECLRLLRTDGVEWSCKPCDRGGYYDRVGSVVVRMVTRWPARALELVRGRGGHND